MDVDVTMMADIRRPREEVAPSRATRATSPAGTRNIRTVEVLTDGPVTRRAAGCASWPGSWGRSIDYTYEVVELVAGERMTMTTASGPFPMTTELRVRGRSTPAPPG